MSLDTDVATLKQQVAALQAQVAAITTPSHAQVVNQMTTILSKEQARADEFRNWQGGVAGGGPHNDGTYPLTDSSGYTTYTKCVAQIMADATLAIAGAMSLGTVQFLNQSSVQLTAAHNGKLIRINSPNPVTVTLASGLPQGWNCLVLREGTGTVTFTTSGTGYVIKQDQSLTKLRNQWSVATLFCSQVSGSPLVSNVVAQGSMS